MLHPKKCLGNMTTVEKQNERGDVWPKQASNSMSFMMVEKRNMREASCACANTRAVDGVAVCERGRFHTMPSEDALEAPPGIASNEFEAWVRRGMRQFCSLCIGKSLRKGTVSCTSS